MASSKVDLPPSTSKGAAIAVYCGSSPALGRALARAGRPLVYGGGSQGIMGIVSSAVVEHGGWVTGIIPYAIHKRGGEPSKVSVEPGAGVTPEERGYDKIIVNSMHERKIEMARRVTGFVGLPGGFGTFEEVFEVITWTQLGIHQKPVILLNVLSFFDPLRQLIKDGVTEGFIKPSNERIVVFVDGPTSHQEHESFDWGKAGLQALDAWQGDGFQPLFDWTKKLDGKNGGDEGPFTLEVAWE